LLKLLFVVLVHLGLLTEEASRLQQ